MARLIVKNPSQPKKLVVKQARNTTKMLKICSFLLFLSIIANITFVYFLTTTP